MQTPIEFIRELRKKSNSCRSYLDQVTIRNFEMQHGEYIKRVKRARWLELGCGSYLEGSRHIDEDHFQPINIRTLIRIGWDVVGVDIVPLGRTSEGWRFIQGDILTPETWDEIGLGYHVISITSVVSFNNPRQISPGFKPRGRSLYIRNGTYSSTSPLEDTDYFAGVDSILTRAHQSLIQGGVIIVDKEQVLAKSEECYLAELGFQEEHQREIVRRPWTIPWLFPRE
jgi:hypothetical protein